MKNGRTTFMIDTAKELLALAERCREIREWHKTGLLCDGALRKMAAEMPVHDEHVKLRLAEDKTAIEAMDLVVRLSAAPGEPCAWQWFSDNTWHTVDKHDVDNPEQYARSISSIVRAIYTTPAPAEGLKQQSDEVFDFEETRRENADNVRTLDAIAEFVGCPHDEELTVNHVRAHYAARPDTAEARLREVAWFTDAQLAEEIHKITGCQVGSIRTANIIKWFRGKIAAVARIIDPDAFSMIPQQSWEAPARMEAQSEAQLAAERKADAILAALDGGR